MIIVSAPFRGFNKSSAPCGGCVDRFLGCHSQCVKYAEFIAKNNKLKAAIFEAKKNDNYVIESTARAARKKIKQI